MNYDDLREAEYAEKRLQAFQKREEEKQEYFKNIASNLVSDEQLGIPSNSNKYSRRCKGVNIDVYDVLKAFNVTCPAMQHAIKKMLCTGIRGYKGFQQDADEAINSIKRAKELNK